MESPGPFLSRLYESRRLTSGGVTEGFEGPTRVLAVCNQKGGCGKTTTAINLAAGLGLKGYPTLLIDLDPQAHATLGLGIDPERLPHTIYDLFHDPSFRLEETLHPTKVPNLWVAPANALLAGAQLELATVINRQERLRQAIKQIGSRFRYLLMDCSPSLNLLTINALNAADYCLVPLQPLYYALEGMRELFTTLDLIRDGYNPGLNLLGILPVLVDGRARVTREILQQIRDYFKEQVLDSESRFSAKFVEASIVGQPVSLYSPCSRAAQDYGRLTEEILSRIRREGSLPQSSQNGASERTAG